MTKSSADGTVSGQLDRLDGSLVQGRLGESARLYRLRIDGHWYFCTASSFAHSAKAGAVLRHVQPPERVTIAPYIVNGRRYFYWLYSHDSGATLEPVTLKRTGVSTLLLLLGPTFGLALSFLWSWANRLSTTLFVVSLPLVIALAVATLFSGLFGVLGLMDVVSIFRPHRLRAYRSYLALRKGLMHGN